MLCRMSQDGQLIFSGSGFIKYRSVLWALLANPPTASCIDRRRGRSDQNLDLTFILSCVGDSLGGALLPHRPWQMIPTHQHKEWLSTV